jgi:UDP-N-acetylmuramoyl-L-alanyl-D-glutamate--2,6-diaminopimelate ligase
LRTLLPEAQILGTDDLQIGRCVSDWRQVEPGDLFAALGSDRDEGGTGIPQAIARGAAAVVCQKAPAEAHVSVGARRASPPAKRQVPGDADVPLCLVPDAREAYGRICQALAGNPSLQLKVIGIAGDNGKTTTSCLLASVLLQAGWRVGLLGSLGYLDGRAIESATQPTPPADTLAALLARMVANGCSHAVVEVSRRSLAESYVAGIRLDVACLTRARGGKRGQSPFAGTARDQAPLGARAPHRGSRTNGTQGVPGPLFPSLLEHLTPEGFAVLNADDPASAACLRKLDGPALTVGIHKQAEIMGVPLEQCPSEQMFLLTAGSETVPVRTRMIGTQHVYHCLTAAAVGLAYGIELAAVVRGLEAVEYVPGRLERIECGQPFGVFVDNARTPTALAACLQVLRKVTAGRLICVFAARGDGDGRRRLGQTLETTADQAVLSSDHLPGKDPRQAVARVLEGFRDPQNVRIIADRAAAVGWALGEAQPGDCVLLAGNGCRHGRAAAPDRAGPDDGQIARQWLYKGDLGIWGFGD